MHRVDDQKPTLKLLSLRLYDLRYEWRQNHSSEAV